MVAQEYKNTVKFIKYHFKDKMMFSLFLFHSFINYVWSSITIRGLLFKFVEFLNSRSEVFDTVLKVIYQRKIYSFPHLLMYKA